MKQQSSSDVAGTENPCIADAAELGGASIASHGDHRKTKPLEIVIAALDKTLEPVEARIEADGDVTVDRIMTVDLALQHAQESWAADTLDQNCKDVLAAEVRRLREALGIANHALAVADNVEDELREASAVTAVNFGKAQLEIARLQTKLARVEAEVAAVRRLRDAASADRDHTVAAAFETAAMYVEDALRDEPQPEREPKLPFNGY